MVTRSLPPLRLLAATLLLAACGDQETGPIAISAIGGPPRMANSNREPLDPASALLLEAAAQGLVRFDAGGEIEPALAQRWIVSDDGRRYIFRLSKAQWSGDGRISSEQVVARLRAAAAPPSRNPLKPILGAIEEIVALPDVIEISLKSPRPSFLQLLAQPELAVVRAGRGTGPYRAEPQPDGSVRLSLPRKEDSDDPAPAPPLLLRGEPAAAAVARFGEKKAELVLGGTLGDLPLARAARTPAGQLRFDPVVGLFGLAFTSAEGPFASVDARQALAMAIDRPALAAALAVPGLQARESLLPPGVEGLGQVSAPAWIREPLPARRARASALLRAAGGGGRLAVRVALPDGLGYRLLFAQLRRDWATVGVAAVRVPAAAAADLRLVDEVAPAGLASWYLRHFSCEDSPVCDPAADEMMAAARIAPDAAARRGLLANADRILAGLGPFIPLTAPVRWSLVAPRLTGFRANVFGRHAVGELIREQP
ncbi:MAG: peptide/nickel transport system substrate-binding protein [Sphingomonadales bacterium]|jgi:peptide/nickel transport system substrate-binding protein|nr:peptide/nickel transport system substrate-binding protein [Sphingomonadales bacterium]